MNESEKIEILCGIRLCKYTEMPQGYVKIVFENTRTIKNLNIHNSKRTKSKWRNKC